MITARIETQTRTFNVKCENNKDMAIDALQEAVYTLTPEDGRCKFIVMDNGYEIYSWEYQPTFREEPKVAKPRKKREPKYEMACVVYTIINGYELDWKNFYHNESFNSVAEAREYMKDNGWVLGQYYIVYEYCVWETANPDIVLGMGLGKTKDEAKRNLNQELGYYDLELTKNGYIKGI